MPAIERSDVTHTGAHTFTGAVTMSGTVASQVATVFKTTAGNVTDAAPTKAELTTEAAAALAVAQADVSVVNDAAGGVNVFLVIHVGTDYYWLKATKAL